jgi:hypothetical protein
MNSAYLAHLPPAVLLAAAWWPSNVEPSQVYFHPRFCVEVPESLLAQVFSGVLAQLMASIRKVRVHSSPAATSRAKRQQ